MRILEVPQTKENENTTCQNLWGTIKAVLRGEFILVNAYIKKKTWEKNPNFTPLKELEKEQIKPKVSRRKEIIKIRAEINKKKGI